MKKSRRRFLKTLGAGSAVLATGISSPAAGKTIQIQAPVSPTLKAGANDKVRLAVIGMGIIGHYDIKSMLKHPGTEFVAAADLYDGRLARTKEVFGKQIFTTRDYRQILERKDVDAVLVCTPDHWHARIATDALAKGKHVYCEKPMIHKIEEGLALVEAQKNSGKMMQVGSQYASNITYLEAKKLYESGAIGDLVMVEAKMNRHSAIGAWQYSIPPDASPKTIDFDRFLGNAPKVAFDPVRFFRWRNYRDYGTGVAGDLYVHLLTGLHTIISSNGPSTIYANGNLCYWKDGRDVPDVLTAIFEYPKTNTHAAFQMAIQVNFVDGEEASYTKLSGTEGSITIGWDGMVLKKTPFPKAPGYGGYDSVFTFAEATQQEFARIYESKFSKTDHQVAKSEPVTYKAPEGYDDRDAHTLNFIEAILKGKPVFEDATFGLRAAAPCLASNMSLFDKKIISWDALNMKLLKS
jgi:predicted dehydrogenase